MALVYYSDLQTDTLTLHVFLSDIIKTGCQLDALLPLPIYNFDYIQSHNNINNLHWTATTRKIQSFIAT